VIYRAIQSHEEVLFLYEPFFPYNEHKTGIF